MARLMLLVFWSPCETCVLILLNYHTTIVKLKEGGGTMVAPVAAPHAVLYPNQNSAFSGSWMCQSEHLSSEAFGYLVN